MTKFIVMRQFTVPQFIDVEDKIIGPLTVRQFLIMLTGFAIIGLSWKFADFSLFATISVMTFVTSVSFAFIKVNGMPMHFFVLNFVQTVKKPGLRVWGNTYDKEEDPESDHDEIVHKAPPRKERRYNGSRLTELSLMVDTRGAYKGDDEYDKEEDILDDEKID